MDSYCQTKCNNAGIRNSHGQKRKWKIIILLPFSQEHAWNYPIWLSQFIPSPMHFLLLCNRRMFHTLLPPRSFSTDLCSDSPKTLSYTTTLILISTYEANLSRLHTISKAKAAVAGLAPRYLLRPFSHLNLLVNYSCFKLRFSISCLKSS